ncbi:endonuclease/exonuclease/phosphatase family protein [Salinigranum halophilum]|jgi:endonuclease/exonuclease/phosphatase family metal-dependent hydrolase|uniref:endonuclease/exonuclease/phosphatase family protein n=1 Tax=Salinigranum halophilum TaxID=2565931 RepID=UPI00191C0EFF|nr:endonuclease/exonuclease/phosphatase family protein [Salinigranum halophilum]
MTEVRCRVMTFNVRYDTAADGEHAWEHRRPLVASVVRYHAPDVVGLQEPLHHQYASLREQLPEYTWEGVGRNNGGSEGEHCPLGWRTARVERERHGTVWLSESPGQPGSSYPTASKPRLVTWARLVVDGAPLVVCNTHFDHESETARVQSARQLRRLVGELGGATDESALTVPVVVLGDFNCTPGSEPYRVLTGAGGDADAEGDPGPVLTDAMDASEHPHHGPTVTFERFHGPPDTKIDHVFVAGDVTVRQHAVVADHWDGRPPSDHCPVVAELVVGK